MTSASLRDNSASARPPLPSLTTRHLSFCSLAILEVTPPPPDGVDWPYTRRCNTARVETPGDSRRETAASIDAGVMGREGVWAVTKLHSLQCGVL